ncbi:MAG: type IV secretion system DNA-binding domain-containing protein [Nevskia sp.]|nr:type IV secretion system DNA-binding domain-containing protein [Nevskia sp.]
MGAYLLFGVVWFVAAAFDFEAAATFDQLAYRKAWAYAAFRHALALPGRPIAVQLGRGQWHRVDAGALLDYFRSSPDCRSDLHWLILGCLLIGFVAACTLYAAVPNLFEIGYQRGHRRGARLLPVQLPAVLDERWRQGWLSGAALALTTWTVLYCLADPAGFGHPLVPDFQRQTLRAVGFGYGLAGCWLLFRVGAAPAARLALRLGHVRIPRAIELYHFLVAGRTGSGKTQAIQQLLRTAHARGDRALIADPDGGYLSRFSEPGDLLLNPFDRRSVRWCPFAEIRSPFDYDVLATAVIPPGNTANEEEWRRFGRVLLAASLKQLREDGRTSAREMLRLINAAHDNELQTMLAGSNAAGLRRHDAMFHSILGVVTPHIQSWEYLPEPDAAHPPFSIRDWVRRGAPGWLFLPYRDDQLDSLKYLIATWTGLAVAEALSLPEDLNRRFWFVIDELDSLGKVASMRLAATKLRKHGGVMVAGLQTIAQLRATYGQDEAQVILSSLANKLILAVGDHETARYFQDELGQREIERSRVVHQTGSGDRHIRSTSRSKDIVLEHLVLASQLQGLGERRGFLRRAGEPLVHPVRIPLVPMTQRLPPFVQAAG